jgi:hypothetical protein
MADKQFAPTSDPFYRLLADRLKLTPVLAFTILLAVGLLDELLGGFLAGYWNDSGRVIGASRDYPHWIVAFFFQPAVWAFFLWLPKATAELFQRVEREAIPAQHRAEYAAFQHSFWRRINSPWVSLAALAVAVTLMLASFYFTEQYRLVPWTHYVAWHRYTIWAARLLAAGYCFAFTIFYAILVMIRLNRVFARYGVVLRPYHGDNVAGLKFIGAYALRLNQLALVGISFLVSDTLLALQVGEGVLGAPNLIIEFAAFPILTVISFAAPLVACHNAMVEAKLGELNRYAAQIQTTMQALQANPNATKSQYEDLGAVIAFRERLVKDIPTLPIDVSGLRTFSLSFVASLIPALVDIVIRFILP